MKKQVLVIDIDEISRKTFEEITNYLDRFNIVYWTDEIEV